MRPPTNDPATTSFAADLLAASLLASSALASAASAQFTVVPVPQAAGSSEYTHAALSSDGSMAVLATDATPVRLVRWNAAGNALVELAAPAAGTSLSANKLANNGHVSGSWRQLASPFVQRGALWLSSGALADSPFGGTGNFGEPVASSTSGSTLFITDINQSSLFAWPLGGTAVALDKPAGTAFVVARDGNLDGSACVVDAITTGFAHRAYRWTSAGGFAAIPLPDEADANRAIAISDDGARAIGVFTGAEGEDGFLWSASTGVVPMGLPAGSVVDALSASGDCTIACGRASGPLGIVTFVWTLSDGLMTAEAFAASRGYAPPAEVEFLDFDAKGRNALARVGGATVLLRNFGRIQCGLSGDCFAFHMQPGCRVPSCCESVCAYDPFCCSNFWDNICVEVAEWTCRTGLTCADARRFAIQTPAESVDTATDPTASDESSCGEDDDHGLWRIYRANCNGAAFVDLCVDSGKTQVVLSVYETCGDEIACSDAASAACGGVGASVGFPVFADRDYLIRASGDGGRIQGTLRILCTPQCGSGTTSCGAASEFPGCNNAACCATICANDPACCSEAWDESCASIARATCYRPADLDYDGFIGPADLAVLLSGWGSDGPSDIDGDGFTGPSDLAELLSSWG